MQNENFKWESESWYLVDVAYNKSNPIHRALFYTGFMHVGKPGNYNVIIGHSYAGEPMRYVDAYYIKPIKKLLGPEDLKGSYELPSQRTNKDL